ncbi:MAG: VWD domain-containing protein, partial [Propionibacteriaceae bacterium]|nr:VWD domain-containing protein [Propionibacteriaceae bacterium]
MRKPQCLNQPKPDNDTYHPAQCQRSEDSDKLYAEAIAQARLVQHYNGKELLSQPGAGVWPYDGVSSLRTTLAAALQVGTRHRAGIITSAIQWEVNLGRSTTQIDPKSGNPKSLGRVDVVMFGPDWQEPSTNEVEVVELKVGTDDSQPVKEAVPQVDNYVGAMKYEFGWGGARAKDMSGYSDWFYVTVSCADGGNDRERWIAKGTTDPGVVAVYSDRAADCEQLPREEENKSTRAKARQWTQNAPVPPPGPSVSVPNPPAPPKPPTNPPPYVPFPPGNTPWLLPTIAKGAVDTLIVTICLGPVNASIRGLGDGSVSVAAMTCLEAGTMVELATILAAYGWEFTAIELEMIARLMEEGMDFESAAAKVRSPAVASGDPHLTTFDGLNYDFHGVGEYRLLQHEPSGLEVQIRTVAAANDMSSISAVAVSTAGFDVEADGSGAVSINGFKVSLDPDIPTYLDWGVYVAKVGSSIRIVTGVDEDGRSAAVVWTPMGNGRGDLSVDLPTSWAGEMTGMLGNFDGDPGNDLVSADGDDVTSGVGFGVSDSLFLQRLYGTFGDSWRVTADNSAFTYADGRSPASYVDRSFPRAVKSLGSLSEAAYLQAAEACRSAGVPEGLGFDDCVLDVGFSGDVSFATDRAPTETFGFSIGDLALEDEPISVDFVGDIPPNFYPGKIRWLADGRNFAGPFTAENGYPFYLRELAGHDTFYLSTRIIVPEGTSAAPVDLVLDGARVTGTTTDGPPEKATRTDGSVVEFVDMSFAVPHSARNLQGKLALKNGAAAWFGVESIQADTKRVPPQVFDIEVTDTKEFHPSTAPTGSGAGVLESAGSADKYCFAVPEGADLWVDGRKLDNRMSWALESVGEGSGTSGGLTETTVSGLSSEACIEIRAEGTAPPNQWRYDFALLLVPGAEVFDLGAVSGAAAKVSAGSRVVMDRLSGWYAAWELTGPDGPVASGNFYDAKGHRF